MMKNMMALALVLMMPGFACAMDEDGSPKPGALSQDGELKQAAALAAIGDVLTDENQIGQLSERYTCLATERHRLEIRHEQAQQAFIRAESAVKSNEDGNLKQLLEAACAAEAQEFLALGESVKSNNQDVVTTSAALTAALVKERESRRLDSHARLNLQTQSTQLLSMAEPDGLTSQKIKQLPTQLEALSSKIQQKNARITTGYAALGIPKPVTPTTLYEMLWGNPSQE